MYLVLLYGEIVTPSNLATHLPNWQTLIPATAIVVAIGVLNSFFSPLAKARFVFLRWHHPLPGSRAFSHFAKVDSRVDVDKLKEKTGAFPKSPRRQNSKWYSIYKAMEDAPEVREAHKNFLLTRDYAMFALLICLVLAPLSFKQFPSFTMALSYSGFLIVQVVLVVRAARVHGYRFVTTVLARKSAEP